MPDVRIGEVTTEVVLADPSAVLSPEVLEHIVEAVLARLDAGQRLRDGLEAERALGRRR